MQTNNIAIGRRYTVFLLVFLGALAAFGPLVTDMYLPVLPKMTDIFNCSISSAQLGLTMSLIGLAAGQLFFGPLSDKYGRKSVLMSSLLLFITSTALIIFSPNIEWFNICRLFQGVGAAGGIVLSRSVATDYYSGKELAKTLAIIGAINGIAPVVSPVVGGVMSTFTGWQGIFMALLGIGVLIMIMCSLFRESYPSEMRDKMSVLKSFTSFFKLLKKPFFVVYVVLYSVASAILFSYISSASFIIQNHYGYSPFVFSICFAINSIFIGVGSGISLKIKETVNASLIGAVILVVTAVSQIIAFNFCDSFIIYELAAILFLTGIGFVFTSSTTLTMTEGHKYIGAASAIFGASGFLFGGIVSPLVGIGNVLYSTMIVISINSVLALILSVISKRRKFTSDL